MSSDQRVHVLETEELGETNRYRLVGCANQAGAAWVAYEAGAVCNFCCLDHGEAYVLGPTNAGTHG